VAELHNLSRQKEKPEGSSQAQPPAAMLNKYHGAAMSKEPQILYAASRSETVRGKLGRDRPSSPSFFPITTYYRGKAITYFERCQQARNATPSQAEKSCFPLQKTATPISSFIPQDSWASKD